jgi:hypothetical protein
MNFKSSYFLDNPPEVLKMVDESMGFAVEVFINDRFDVYSKTGIILNEIMNLNLSF